MVRRCNLGIDALMYGTVNNTSSSSDSVNNSLSPHPSTTQLVIFPIPAPLNTHYMATRAKSGAFKPKLFHSHVKTR